MARPDLRLVALLASATVAGCGGSAGADAPDASLRHVLQRLADDQPRALWDALPRSYQDDLHGLLRAVAGKLDAEVYDQAFALGRRFLDVVDDKRALVLAQLPPILPRDTVEELWKPLLEAGRAVLQSQISSVHGLKTLDIGAFLGTTGHRAMAQLSAAFARQGGSSPRQALEDIEVELLHASGDTATVRVASPQHALSEEVAMTRVEGRWVPTAMAQQWGMAMSRARTAIDRMPSMSEATTRAIAKAELGRLEEQLDAIASATTARELAAALRMNRTAARPR